MDDQSQIRAPKRTPPKSSGKAIVVMQKIIFYAAIFLSISGLILLAFVSIDLALLGFVILSLSGFYWQEHRRESQITSKFSAEIKRVVIAQNDLIQGVSVNTQDIKKIKEQLKIAVDDFKSGLQQTNQIIKPPLDIRSPARRTLHERLDTPMGAHDTEHYDPADIRDTYIRARDRLHSQANHTSTTRPAKNLVSDEIQFDAQSMSDIVVRELLHNAVRNKKIDVFLQPVIRLPGRHIIAYELFARIRAKPGIYLPASRYLPLARAEDKMSQIDNLVLLHGLEALEAAEIEDIQASFFINLQPDMLRDKLFMNTLLTFISQHKQLASSLVFEIAQDDFETLQAPERKILSALAKVGCAYSVDNIKAIPEDIRTLQDMRVRYVKIHAKFLLDAAQKDKDFSMLMKQKRRLESNGIGVIVDHIEDERTLVRLSEYNIGYGQGYLFGRPHLGNKHSSAD